MGNPRITIESASIAATVVTTNWTGELTYKRDKDQVFHDYELKSDITIQSPDFDLINDLADDCEVITLTIETLCAGAYTTEWTGTFTKFDCSFDLDKCLARVRPKADIKENCLRREWQEPVLVNAAVAVIISRAFSGTYEAPIGACQDCRPTYDPMPCNDSGITDACVYSMEVTQPNTLFCPGNQYLVETYYHRVVGVGTPTTPPPYGTGWTYISGNDWWRCPDNEEIDIGVLRYGRLFSDVFAYLMSQTGCGLTVRSHFFGINATHTGPPSNDAYTYASAHYQDMTVHQKSDVKRPDASNYALSVAWKMKLRDFLNDMRVLFNCYWKIDGSSFIIEHVSYFDSTAGPNHTATPQKLEYKYDEDTPKREKFFFFDESASSFFAGYDIVYDCGEDIKEHRCQLFGTDISYIRDELNQDKIADEGFVLVCNQVDGSTYYIDEKNQPLSWTNLHDNLHRHNRPFGAGSMNNAPETFTTTHKIKKQTPFSISHCCDDTFDPAEYVTTPIGNGYVDEATKNLFKDRITLNLAY